MCKTKNVRKKASLTCNRSICRSRMCTGVGVLDVDVVDVVVGVADVIDVSDVVEVVGVAKKKELRFD